MPDFLIYGLLGGNATNVKISILIPSILYHIEYSSGYAGVSVGYPTFSIAYLIYSTSQINVIHGGFLRSMISLSQSGSDFLVEFETA